MSSLFWIGGFAAECRVGIRSSHRDTQAYSATLTAKLGSVDLTAVSGYSIRQFYEWQDYTSLYGTTAQQQFGVTGSPVSHVGTTYRFTQEIRLNGSIGPKFEWLLGGYYNHEDSPADGGLLATVLPRVKWWDSE